MPKRNLAWILVVALIALLFWRMPQTIAGRDEVYTAFAPLVDVRAQILKRSAEPVDDEKLSAAASHAGIEAMVRALNDPYALYLDRETYPAFRKQTEGVFGGIGVDVQLTPEGLQVLSRVRGSPAAKAGLMPGETIAAIDDIKASELGLVDGVNRLSGVPGTPVRLLVLDRDGKSRTLKLTRQTIEINPVRGWSRRPDGSWRYWLDEKDKIAYVRLIKFMPNAVRQLDSAVGPLLGQGLRGLVLDLRENTGGMLRTAIDVADRFLDSGLIVATRGPKMDARQWNATREDTYNPPFRLVVMVNGSTASAAEVVAGALHDHGRAIVVGERSYGKGSVQELVPLEDGQSALKLTTGHYYLPSGICLQKRPGAGPTEKWGVEPDVVVALTDAERRRWIEAWYLAGAEAADEGDPAGEETIAESEPSSQPSLEEIALERTLDADRQLAEALKLLRSPERAAGETGTATAARGGAGDTGGDRRAARSP